MHKQIAKKQSRRRSASAQAAHASIKKLTKTQQCVIDFIDGHKQFLVCLGTGSGKTLIAVMAAANYIHKYPQNRVVVITPAGLGTNFQNELNSTEELNIYQKQSIEYFTFEQFANLSATRAHTICSKAMLIVDEAHNLRTSTTNKYKSVFSCAEVASKRLLLTATPFVNGLDDISNIISVLTGEPPDLTSDHMELANRLKPLKNNVIFMQSKVNKHFPSTTITKVFVRMTPDYHAKYLKILAQNKVSDFKNARTFLHGYRKAANSLSEDYTSSKIDAAIKFIKKSKTVIYSNWLEYGQRPIARELERKKMSYRLYDGSLSASVRQKVIDDFNDDLFQVLIISTAGGTGINLKGVRTLIVMDPPWSPAVLRQIEGRVARYNSHGHLPAAQRHVNIYEMVQLTGDAPKSLKDWRKDSESGDVMLYLLLEEKLKQEEAIYKLLKKMSIKCQ